MKKVLYAFRNLIFKSDYINFVPPSPPNFKFMLHPWMRYVWKKEIICWPIQCIQSLFLYFFAWKLHFSISYSLLGISFFLSFHLLVYFLHFHCTYIYPNICNKLRPNQTEKHTQPTSSIFVLELMKKYLLNQLNFFEIAILFMRKI